MNKIKKDRLVASNDGIYLGSDKVLGFIPKVIAVKEIWTGEESKIQYDIEISIQGEVVDRVTVHELYQKSWYDLSRRCPDAEISDKMRKMIQRFLQEQAAQLPALRLIDIKKMGWHHIDEGHVYRHDDVIICGATDEVHFESPGCNIIRTADLRSVIGNSRAVLEMIEQTAVGTSWILYLISFLDILKEPFRKAGHPIEFISNVYGCSGSGKTSLIKTLCSPSQIFSFRSQKRRDTLLREAKGFSGQTVLFDDYHPAENKADRDRQGGIKDSLVRMVEEVADAPNIIVSSEYLEGHLSLQDREIQIFLDKNMDWGSLNELTDEQEQLENIRIAFYVQIVEHAGDVVADIKRFCNAADSERCADKSYTYRNVRYASYIRCVEYLFHKYFIEAYRIEWHCDIDDDLQKHMKQQGRHMEIIAKFEHDRSYIPILRDMLLDESSNGLECVQDRSRFRCDPRTYYVDPEQMLFISPDALRRGLMVYLRSRDIPLKKMIKEMIDADLLETYGSRVEYTKKCQYGRYYKIDTKRLEEYCSLFE